MNAHVQRARVLLEQSRYDLAEEQLRLGLAEDPNDAMAFSLLALCLSERKRFKEATEAARRAIHLEPDSGFSHYALACVLNERDRPKEAELPAREAVRLEPEEPLFHGMLALVYAHMERWQEALTAAEQGLRLDPEHGMCVNARAFALAHLGRRTEAIETTQSALADDPENAITHANHGWMLLRHQKPQEAMVHFKEALRLDPSCDWAREGIVEALKARNRVYRLLLRYMFWMATLSPRARWGVIIGLYVAQRVARSVVQQFPQTGIVLWPFIGLYVAFLMLTWLGQPMFNLLLRLSRFGRLALSDEQRRESNWVGLCMLGVPVCVVGFLLTAKPVMLLGAIACWLLVLPVAGVFKCAHGWPRTVMTLYAISTALIFASGMALGMMQDAPADAGRILGPGIAGVLLALCLLLAGVSTWIINLLAGVRPRK